MKDLAKRKCVPCEGGTPPLEKGTIARWLPQLRSGWKVSDDQKKLSKRFLFTDFKAAMVFLNDLARVAEEEQHHPDFTVHYNIVDVTLYTHAIGALSENDFILAAKIDTLRSARIAR